LLFYSLNTTKTKAKWLKREAKQKTSRLEKEEEENCKPFICADSVTMTTRNTITKRKTPKNNIRTLPTQQVKVEQDTDTKSL
jgi:predicted house-cleaning NTP pyrophosphatase (Maf/HAM1 superfamily)